MGGVGELVDRTPTDRDRYVDFLRGASILMVVLGHWLISVVVVSDGVVSGTAALASVHGLQLATWVFQVMPVFFFVGGFSNLLVIKRESERGGTYGEYLTRRMSRLLRPTMLFVVIWIVATALLEHTSVKPASVRFVAELAAQPLWFLAVYVLIVALAPPMVALHRRWPVVPFVVLPALVIGLDVLNLGQGLAAVAMGNYVFVFLFAQQLGFLYGDGWLVARSKRFLLGASAAAFGTLVLLTDLGPYPVSMVGVPGATVSNMSPPTLCILVLTIGQVGLLMVLRTPMNRWLQRKRLWTATVLVNARIMTVFLWHLTALLLVGSAAILLGVPLYEGGTAGWWAGRPVWILCSAVVLVALVAAFGWAEKVPTAPDRMVGATDPPRPWSP